MENNGVKAQNWNGFPYEESRDISPYGWWCSVSTDPGEAESEGIKKWN